MFLSEYINLKFLVNLLLISVLAISFLTIFFFLHGADIEKEIVENNLNYIIDESIDNYVILLSDEQKKEVYKKLNEFKFDNMDEEDEKVKSSNKKLQNKSFIITGILIVCVFIIVSGIVVYKNYNYTEILLKNSILLVGIAMVEYLFLLNFGSKFISANTNYIKGKIAALFYNPDIEKTNTTLLAKNFINEMINNPEVSRKIIKYINDNPESVNLIKNSKSNPNAIGDFINGIKI
jgi:hypothetical protein